MNAVRTSSVCIKAKLVQSYVTVTLDSSEATERKGTSRIDSEIVRKAIGTERLAEDMELELSDLFPKHADLRLQAVKLLMRLKESGPIKQGELGEQLGMEPYALSRLLTKLELHRYVTCKRERTNKMVSLSK